MDKRKSLDVFQACLETWVDEFFNQLFALKRFQFVMLLKLKFLQRYISETQPINCYGVSTSVRVPVYVFCAFGSR